jgi:hypothetical protein
MVSSCGGIMPWQLGQVPSGLGSTLILQFGHWTMVILITSYEIIKDVKKKLPVVKKG